jgi:choline-sulfatase
MADQMTAALTGVYGHPVVKTPGLDRLAAEGVRFDAAYTNCPLCVPARAAMLSGRHVSRTRTYDNGAILPCDVPTYAHHLRASGYEVVASGKLHLIGADQLHGFERRFTTDIYPSTFKWTPSWQGYQKNGIANDKAELADEGRIGVCDWSRQLDYDTEVQFRALEFLRARRQTADTASDRPFCLLVSYTHPHPPYQITPEYWNMYEGAEIEMPSVDEDMTCPSQMDRWLYQYEGVPRGIVQDADRMYSLRRSYYGMVSFVDAQVAELIETLGRCGLRDSTAIIFTADHGDMLCERQLIEKRAFYEWSARVPLIASFPKNWATGATCAEPVSLIDFFPTIIEFAGAPAPTDTDGQSFLGLLESPRERSPERVVFSEYHGEGVASPCFMARKGTFKYVHIFGHEPQLFNLADDPNETRNLAGKRGFGEIERSLHQEIMKQFDPEAIAVDVTRSQAERTLMQRAMNEGERTRWDYQPFFDETKRYVR